MTPEAAIVVPTVGRPSLATLLDAIATQEQPGSGPVTLVDDRVETVPAYRHAAKRLRRTESRVG